jgi:hypothetical protein
MPMIGVLWLVLVFNGELIMETENDNAALWVSLDGSVIIDDDAIYFHTQADVDDQFAFDNQIGS